MRTDFTEVYAVPDRDSILDTINPDTGLTQVHGLTETEMLARNPEARRMNWEDFRQAAAARQDTPIEWLATTPDKYDEMLNVLPPALWVGGAFLVGEPCDHSFATGAPRFAMYWHRGGGVFLTAHRPVTVHEFRMAIGGAA
jgi:hypothetical protein